MRLVLLGGPGAGKGTQSKILSEHFKVAHISTGDILRKHMEDKTEIGVEIRDIMDAGDLVADDLVTGLLKARVKEDDCKNGFVLDGYPRTLVQAEILTDVVGEVDKIVFINLADDYVIQRMSGRFSCPNCGAMFHIINNPPKRVGICDNCGTALIQREDDRARTVENRLKVYHELTTPIIDYFRERGCLAEVSGVGEISDITAAITAVLS